MSCKTPDPIDLRLLILPVTVALEHPAPLFQIVIRMRIVFKAKYVLLELAVVGMCVWDPKDVRMGLGYRGRGALNADPHVFPRGELYHALAHRQHRECVRERRHAIRQYRPWRRAPRFRL